MHLEEKQGRLEAGQIVSSVVTCRDGGLVQLVCEALDGLPDGVRRYFDALQVRDRPSVTSHSSVPYRP